MILKKVNVPDSVPQHMREPLGLLTGEVWDLHSAKCLLWDICIDVPETVNLILATAPQFFGHIQSILFEHLISGIARLTDPAEQGQFRNLTFDSIFDSNKTPKILELQVAAKDVRDIRRKIVAHLDYTVGLNPNLLPNDRPFAKIRKCVDLMVEIVDLAWAKWTGGGAFPMECTDAMEVINCLQKARAYELLEQNGVIAENFWNFPEDMKADVLHKMNEPDTTRAEVHSPLTK
jgi:hypothetical protein